jgi:hypothetical protein
MKKLSYLIVSIIILSNSALNAQNWIGIGGGMNKGVGCFYHDSVSDILYFGGGFAFYSDTVYTLGIAAYNGDSVFAVGCGFDWNCISELSPSASPNGLNDITKYNGEIIGGGAFFMADGKPIERIARWNGVMWDSLGHGVNGPVNRVYVYGNELYVGGSFDSAGYISANGLAKWNGLEWLTVGSFPNNHCCGDINFVRAIKFFNGELYVGGKFHDSLNNPMNIARYDGNTWKSVGDGLTGSFAGVNDMEIYNDELYVAGVFKKSEGNPDNNIARWDGEEWHEVGGGTAGIGNGSSQIYDLHVYNNELYAAGIFSFAGGVPAQRIAKWDGQQWCGLGSTFDNVISGIGVYNNELYIGGGFWTIDGDSILRIAKWIGGNYTDTCGAIIGVEENNIETFELEIYPNPATNLLTIKTNAVGKAEYFIYDINGRKITQSSILNGQSVIDVSSFAKGLYLLQVQTDKGSVNRKFIKMK